jgi:shikimate kinase
LIYYGQVLPVPVLRVKNMDNIILIGMPGSGKSSVGVVLAKALGKDFLDVDLLIQSREGTLLQNILDSRGVETFLDVESEAIRSVSCRRTVIAPGGSCVCRDDAMEHLSSLGTVVYLKLSYPEVVTRIHNLDSRGIALQPGQTLADVYNYRVPRYERYADITVKANGQTLVETIESVKKALTEYAKRT